MFLVRAAGRTQYKTGSMGQHGYTAAIAVAIYTLENVWLKQPKIWFGQPNNLVDMALTKCLVETNQTAQPNVFG